MINPNAIKGLASVYNTGNLTGTCTNRNTWYTFTGTITSSVLIGFTLASNVLTCQKPGWYVFSGDAGYSVTAACNIHYGLFLNASATPIAGLDTPRDVVNASKVTTFGANQAVYLAYGDTLTLKCEITDADGKIITCSNLNMTLREA